MGHAMTDGPSKPERVAEMEDLRARLSEAEETLRAIRNGEVDAVVVAGQRGEQVYTLIGADHIYRQLIESMSEGAMTLSADGVILYGNIRLAEMLGRSLGQVLGTTLWTYLSPSDPHALDAILAQARIETCRREISLKNGEGRLVPVYLSASRFQGRGLETVFCLVLTDLTEKKRHEQMVSDERLARLILEQAAEAIVVCDAQGRVIRVSQAAEVFCVGSPFLRSFGEVFPLRTDASGSFHLDPVLRGDTLRSVDVDLDWKGQTLNLILNAGPLLSDRQFLGCVVTLTDITERKRAEAELLESEERLRLTLDAASAVAWVGELDGDSIVEVGSVAEVFGKPAGFRHADLQSFLQDIHPDDQARVITAMQLGAGPYTVEFRVPLADGCVRWLHASGRFKYDAQHHPTHVMGITRDITERKRAEDALQENTAFLNTLLESMPAPVFYRDTEGRYTGFNKAFETFLGTTRAELIGRTAYDIFPRELAAIYHAKDLELLRNPGVQVYDAKMSDAHGVIHDVVFHKATFTDSGGKVAGLIGVMLDITERVRSEESHARLATAVEHAAETIVITDADATILYVNPAFEKTTGYTREEAIGRNPRILKSGKQDAEFYRRMWAVLAAGEVWRGNFINKRKDGTLYEENVSISPMRDAGGKIVNYVAVKRDVTHLAQLEGDLRQAQKMEAVGRLAGGVAHDFNNLLMGIMGYVELCRDGIGLDDPMREWLDEIMSDALRSAEITRQLLAFARKQTITPKVLDLNDAVAGMLKLLRRLIGENIHLAWLPGLDLGLVKLDPSQIDQVLANLCVNARDAIDGVGKITMETGTITIDADYCASHADAIPGDYVSLTVSDDGCGMDSETLAQIFEPFFTTKGVGKGTGLGLATVYGIVKQNKGFIHVSSEPGRGTAFTIHLPRMAAESVAAVGIGKAEAPKGRGEVILLVEDEKSLRVTCSLFMEALEYKVLVAETPGEALKISDGYPGDIHLLLTDVIMPGMDGIQLAKRLSTVRPDLKVLFMSGYTADVMTQRGVLEQGVAFIAKPFMRDELARKLREMLDRQ